MILIVASARDETAAPSLALRWRDFDARVLTFADLSIAGWRYELPAGAESFAVAAGKSLRTRDITGVVSLTAGVTHHDLPHIAEPDRAYVGVEMQAFLVAWLDSLPCPVLNRPTPGCLCGPNWRRAQWIRCAAELGIPVVPLRLTTGGEAPVQPSTASVVVVVGENTLGEDRLAGHARRIARAAGVEFLEVHFDERARFAGVNLLPDLSNAPVAELVLDHLRVGVAA